MATNFSCQMRIFCERDSTATRTNPDSESRGKSQIICSYTTARMDLLVSLGPLPVPVVQ